jgi:CHAT domain-containing protein/Tfp pilus assembly protein PilF
MTQDVTDRNTIKQYLLGKLARDEQSAPVEERLLTDDDFFEEFQLVKEDLIDEYVSGELIGEERARFEQHFLTTPERRESLRQAQALARYAQKSVPGANGLAEKKTTGDIKSRRPRFTWAWLQPATSWKLAASVLLLIGLAFGLWRVFLYHSDVKQGLLALNAAYRLQRPVEARVSGLDYAPLANTRGDDKTKADPTLLRRAERILLDAGNDEPGPDADHALGLFYLTELKFDQAIEQFRKALAINEYDAKLQSDMGAALLEKGKLNQLNREDGKSLEEFAESLEHLNRAIALNDSLLEALFNRALCHQYMPLPQQAAEDWRKYLEKDSQSPWADEARQNLKLIESQKNKTSQNKEQILQSFLNAYRAGDEETAWQLIHSNRDVTGSFIENALLDRYVDMEANADVNEARENLQALSYAGELELKRANDRFISDLIRFYQSVAPSQRASLAEARRLMNEGHKNLQTFKPEEAAEYYGQAKLIFERMGNDGESVYISYPMGHAYWLMHKSELSLSLFQSVARDSESNQYRWLLAQALNGLANVQTGLNDYSTALDHSNRSWEISEQIGDVRGLMKTADQLSNIYTRLGNYHKAIEYQQQGLALVNRSYVEPLQAWRSNFLMATPLQLLDLNAAAADFQKEALGVAKEAGLPYYICRSYIGLGVIYGSQHNYEEATKYVQSALDLAKNISSDAIRNDTLAYSSLQLGHLYRQAGDFNKAMASYDQVLKTYDGSDYQAFRYAAHKGKLLSCMAQGGCPSVEQEIEATLNLFENYRPKILEEENKFIFFDAEQSVYDVVIDYEHSIKHNFQTAFEFSERSLARSLLDLTSTETLSLKAHDNQEKGSAPVFSQPMGLDEIRQRMPEQAQILQYAVLPNKILIWLISKAGVQSFEQKIDAKDLREKVSTFLRLLSSPPVSNEEEVTRTAADFYDLLIKPIEPALDRSKQLCIVPDKVLNYLPYGAFISASSGKYLTQEYILTRAPSSTLFIISSENARSRNIATPEKLLSVGNPRFDHRAFPMLKDLPAARREAEEVAAYYDSPPAITGDKALKSLVVSEMERANVIHLALHAVVNEQSPLRSKLLFTRETSSERGSLEEDDILQTDEIYKIRLPQTRLVVLSACQTGAGRYYGGEGVISISRPFIAKGVPLVVASLWPVDSKATAELMISFHKNRKSSNLSTAEALSLAQREMLGNPENPYRQPYYWASFVTIGGYARF